jgi:hypothetical protein
MLYNVEFVTIVNNRKHNIVYLEEADSEELAVESSTAKILVNPYVVITEILSVEVSPFYMRQVIHM